MAAPPEPEPQTLAAGELVWAKTKGRQHWWPARLRAAADPASKDAPVSIFGDDEPRTATGLRRFADPAANKMARAGHTARGFLGAVELAHAAAVALLCTGLTCVCASPPPAAAPAAGTEGAAVVVAGGLANLSPSEFLASLRRAALDAPAVGLLDRARLTSWARALAQGWGPAGAGHYPRRSVEELVDKIDLDDLDEPARDASDAADEDSDKAPPKTPAQRKRRGRPRKEDASRTEELDDAGEEDDQKDESAGGPDTDAALSTGRKRKKSKYLSPPYCYLSSSVLDEKPADLPKESLPNATKEEKKVLRDNVDAREVLELVRGFGEGFFHESQLPKATERFLGLLRSSSFAGVDIAGLVSDSGAALKLGKSVLERSRKKDEVGAGGSSVRRKRKMEETSPTATLDFPAEIVVALDGADVAGLVSDSSAALEKGKGVVKRGRKKKDQDGSGGSSIKTKKVEKTSPEAAPELTAEHVSAAIASADGTGLVPHSCATIEQGKAVRKRGRKKKDQDGSGGSSIKRKKVEKTSPTPIIDSGLVITPAVPIRQVRAEDMISQVSSGQAGAGMGVGVLDQNKLASKSPISAAMSGGMKSGEEQEQADGGSVVKTPVTVEATIPETNVNVECVVAGLAAKSVQAEETKPGMGIQVDMNVPSGIDVPITSVRMEAVELETNIPVDTNEQGMMADVPVGSGLLVKDGGISQPADGYTNNANAEVSTVQGILAVGSGLLSKDGGISQSRPADGKTNNANVEVQESYASLEAMMPEIYKKYKEVDIITRGNATRWNLVRVDDQTGEQTSQKVTAGEAIANHAPAISTNGTWSNQPNSTPMRRNMKAPQYFANPAEILLEFTDGVILPSKEELLSAFSKFGILIESASDILEDLRGARVVFGKSAEAEAAYTKRETPGIFGQFGPPFATLERLNYLPPFTPSIPPFMPSIPPPALKPPLNDAEMKKNLQNMISSLAAATSAGARPPLLISDMERLLLQIDNKEAGPSSSASAP